MPKFIKLFLIATLTTQAISGQKLVNSPYSRFGPGTLEPSGNFKNMSMGGTGVAMRDPLSVNYLNPASFSSVDTNSFVFDFGLDYRMINLSNNDNNYTSDDINFHHLLMAFPVSKKIGIATGVIPYSSGYYNISYTIESGDAAYDPVIGEVVENHKGTGGYNKYFFGAGINPIAGLSVGASMSFLFGEVERSNNLAFLDDNNYYNNHSKESINMHGYNFELGAQYQHVFKNDYFASAGFTWSTQATYSGDIEELTTSYSNYSSSYYSVDTIHYSASSNADIVLPERYSFGLAIGKKDKFIFLADYTKSDWTEAVFSGQQEYFTSSNSINLGAEFTPNKSANYNILNRVEYRLGGRITNSHLIFNNEQIKEFGITFGAGLPLRRSNSRINLYFEYGNRGGSFENGLHKETFYNFGLSFNFYDYWFIKRKYD